MLPILIFCDAEFRVQCATAFPEPYTGRDMTGVWLWSLLVPEDEIRLRALVAAALCEKREGSEDVRFKRGGKWRLHVRTVPLVETRFVVTARPVPDALSRLTSRQRELCGLIIQGLSPKACAAKLDVVRGTVDNTRTRLAETLEIPVANIELWCGEHREWLTSSTKQ